MKKLILTGVFQLSIFVGLFAQSLGNIQYNTSNRWNNTVHQVQQKAYLGSMNEFVIDLDCMYNTNADSYLAIFHITQIGETAREADSLINKRIDDFKASLYNKKIEPDDVVIDMLSMVPLYEIEVTKKVFSKTYNEVPAGFEIQKNIHIHFDDEQLLDGIITSAAINEIYDLVKVDYYVKDTHLIYDTLRTMAIDLINKRVEELEAIGIEMDGQWRMAADQIGVYFPMDRYQSYQAFSYTSVESINKKNGVTQMKKPTTMYYNKLPYTNYDFIMNPEIIEPAVQYTYNIQVKFQVLPKPEKKGEVVEKEVLKYKYMLVTDDGAIKELPTK